MLILVARGVSKHACSTVLLVVVVASSYAKLRFKRTPYLKATLQSHYQSKKHSLTQLPCLPACSNKNKLASIEVFFFCFLGFHRYSFSQGSQDKRKCPCMFHASTELGRQKQVLAIHHSGPFVTRHRFIEVDRMSISKELFSTNRLMCCVSQMERK